MGLAWWCWTLISRIVRRFLAHDGLQSASHIAFTAVIATIPLIVSVISSASLIAGVEATNDLTDVLLAVLPADIAHTLRPSVVELLESPRIGLVAASIGLTLWTGSASVEALRLALSEAMGRKRTRGWWHRRLQSLATVITCVGVLLGLTFALYGQSAFANDPAAVFLSVGRLSLVALVAFAVIGGLYRWLPDTRPPWRHVAVGSAVATSICALISVAFAVVIGQFSAGNLIYGSLSGVIATLTFLYFLAAAVVVGAELCAELASRARADTA